MTVVISNLNVMNTAPIGTVVGALTAMDDKGTVIPCNFMLTKQAAGYFGISSGDLATAWAESIKPGNYPVTVRANGINTRFSAHAKFTITVTAVEPPPLPVPTGIKFNPVKASLTDNAVAGTTVATFAVSTSNGSPFSGTLGASPAGTVAIVGTTRLVLARSLNSTDDGLQQWGVTATASSVSAPGSSRYRLLPARHRRLRHHASHRRHRRPHPRQRHRRHRRARTSARTTAGTAARAPPASATASTAPHPRRTATSTPAGTPAGTTARTTASTPAGTTARTTAVGHQIRYLNDPRLAQE
jgi:hypothetical protein